MTNQGTQKARTRIGHREIQALRPGETIWDAGVRGFGARRQQSDAISYFLFYRTIEGRQRWYTIGRYDPEKTPDDARKEAKRLQGEVARGGDPAASKGAKRKAKTVSELCDLYIADADAGRLLTRRRSAKKPSTISTDRGRIERHVKPLLGRFAVAAVSRQDVEDFMHDVARGKTAGRTKTAKKRGLARVTGGQGTASRTLGLLGAIFTYAVRQRMRADNPVHGIARFADGRRERRLSDDEYKAFGTALAKAAEAPAAEPAKEGEKKRARKAIWPAAIAAARFLALTGWRSGEALGLHWEEVDVARRTAILGDTKTGRSVRPLSHAACDVLKSLTRSGEFVFPATRGNGRMSGFPKLWARIAELGALPADVTPHTLRHSFCSLAADCEYSETTIAALVGHKRHTSTSKYIHAADQVLLAAADAVADATAELMGQRRAEGKVVRPRFARRTP